MQPGTAIEGIYKMKSLPEPRLIIFTREHDLKGFIIAEKQILFAVDSFTLLVSLIATYYAFYVSYPKSSPATGVLLFIQELLLEQSDITMKTTNYVALTNSIVSN